MEKMKNNIELKIYKAIFYMLLIAAIVVISMIVYKYGSNLKNEKESQEAVAAFSNIDFSKNEEESGSQIQLEYKGYKVIGIVKIPKINLEYPILEIGDIDPDNAKAPMKLSIIKYWGENVNDYGNLSIAGHNNKDGTMFGKTKKLENGDIIELTDLDGKTLDYKVYDTYVIDPYDNACTSQLTDGKTEITLITCHYENGSNHATKRFVVKARADI